MNISTMIIWVIFGFALIASGVTYFRYFVDNLSKVSGEIKNLIEYLNDLKRQANDNPGFYVQNFEDTAKKFDSYETVRPIWNDFKKSLIHHKDSEDEAIYSTADASEYFSFQNFTQGMNMTFWQGYGGTFTGLGILGTFAGLTLGLKDIDMTNPDIEVLKSGIAELLSGVEFAFFTSLIGIGTAIVYGFYHNHRVKNFMECVQTLGGLIEEMFPRRSFEYWLHENYMQTSEQTMTMKHIATDIAEAFADSFGQRFDDDITRLCEQIEEKITPLFENVCDSIGKLGNGGANAVTETMSKFAGSQMQNFAESLNTFTGNIQNTIVESRRTSDEMNKIILQTLSEMQSTLNSGAEDAANQMRNATLGLHDTISKHDETVRQTYERTEILLQRTEKFLSTLESATSSFGKAAEPFQKSINSLKDGLEKTALMMSRLATENLRTEQSINFLTSTLQSYEKNIETAWTNYENNFNRVGGELEKAVDIVTKRLSDYNEAMNGAMTNYLQDFDKSVSRAVGLLKTSVEELQETVEDVFKENARR